MSDEEVVTYPIDDGLAALEHIDFVVRAMSHIVFVHLSEARSHWCLELRAIGSSARERSTQCTLIVAVQRTGGTLKHDEAATRAAYHPFNSAGTESGAC